MKKQIKNQSYTSTVTKNNLIEELHRKTRIVNDLADVLTQHGELPTLEAMREYQVKGADFKRRTIIEELDQYIESTKMPVYLQESARKEALRQVNNRLISEVGDVLDGINFELIADNLQYDEGCHAWQFTQAFSTAYLAPAYKKLTDDEQASFEVFQRLCRDYMTLITKGYNITGTLRYGNLDAPASELAERFVGSRGSADISTWMFAPQASPDVPTPHPHKPIEIVDNFQWSDRFK